MIVKHLLRFIGIIFTKIFEKIVIKIKEKIMKSQLEELYYASEGLVERISVSREYKKVNEEFEKVYEGLLESLNEEQKKLLDELYYLSGGLESEAGITHFKEGFKFCMHLIFEGISK